MAQEQATITFTLDDQFSSKMQEIQAKLEQFKARLQDAGQRGRKGFEDVGGEVDKIGQRLTGIEFRLSNMSTFMRGAFTDFARSLASTQKDIGGLQTALLGLSASADKLVPVLRGVGGAVAGF